MSFGMGIPSMDGQLEREKNPEQGPEAELRQRWLKVAEAVGNIADAAGIDQSIEEEVHVQKAA